MSKQSDPRACDSHVQSTSLLSRCVLAPLYLQSVPRVLEPSSPLFFKKRSSSHDAIP
jgi:hypothetical protein